MEKFLNKKLLTLFFFPFIIGSLTVFSFQPFNLTIINFLILPIFFYLIIYIKKKSKSTYRKKPFKINLFLFGTSFGFGFYLSGIHWIVNSLTFDENFRILIPFGLILIPIFLSLFFSITTLIVGPYLDFNFKSILLLSASLAFSDFIKSKILTGFPWNLWAYSFSWATEILQILNKLGLFAFNLIIITIFILPAYAFFNAKFSKKMFSVFAIFAILAALHIHGNYIINQNKNITKTYNKKYYTKVVSPNFKLEYGLSDVEIEKRLAKLIRFSDPNKDLKTIFVWPEGVFSGYNFNEILKFKKNFSTNFSDKHLILFGINNADKKSEKYYNSLIIVNNRLEVIYEYKKRKLVPFGEFLPFENILNRFGLKKITEGYGSFLKGKKQDNYRNNNLSISPLICYEIIFTELIQKSNQNTNLVVNISEDGWFGNSIGPYQHFAKGIFRAIEQNSYLIRSANKGITAIVSNKGEIIKKLEPYEAGNIDLEVPLISSNKKNKNDLIFFILLFTYILILIIYKNKNVEK